MPRFPDILKCGFASGITHYDDHYPGHEHYARIVVVVSTASVPNIPAIVDTGSPWCILDPELVLLGETTDLQGDAYTTKLVIRGESYEGKFIRTTLTLDADEGETLEIETSVFVPMLEEDTSWVHPNFIGLGNF